MIRNDRPPLPLSQAERRCDPTPVIGGEDDPSGPLRNTRVLAARISDARLHVVKGGGHLCLLEEPRTSMA